MWHSVVNEKYNAFTFFSLPLPPLLLLMLLLLNIIIMLDVVVKSIAYIFFD